MRKLVALLAFLSFAPSAFAAGAEFSHSGDMRLQYKNDKGKSLADTKTESMFQQRLRWGTTFRKGDKFTGQLSLVHGAEWGDATNANAGYYPDFRGVNGLIVNEAYMQWMASDSMTLRAGRGSFTMGNGKVVSKNSYEQVAKAFDGMILTHDHEMVRTNAFFVRGAELTGGNNNDPKGDFIGFNFDLKSLPEFLKTANLHLIQINKDASAVAGEKSNRFGLTVGGDMVGVDYEFTYAGHTGKELVAVTGADGDDISASMMDLTVGYSMPDMMNFRVHVDYHTDSGDKTADNKKEAYTGFHYDTHYNAGLMDIVQYGNLTFMSLGFSLEPMEDLMVGFDYYTFTRTEKGAASSGDGTNSGTMADYTKDDLGTEMDLTVKKKYDDNFSVEARYSTFEAGDAYIASAGREKHTQLLLTGAMSF